MRCPKDARGFVRWRGGVGIQDGNLGRAQELAQANTGSARTSARKVTPTSA